MKLITLFENVRSKLLEAQTWFLERGWDDVEFEQVSDDAYEFILTHYGIQRVYRCVVDEHQIKHWYTTDSFGKISKTTQELQAESTAELLNIIIKHDVRVRFTEKPDSFEAFSRERDVPYSKLRPLIDDGLLQVFRGKVLYGKFDNSRPGFPLNNHQNVKTPNIFVIEFGNHDLWLVDSAGATTYYREWARIDYEV